MSAATSLADSASSLLSQTRHERARAVAGGHQARPRVLHDTYSRFGAVCAAKAAAYRLLRRLCRAQVGHVLFQDIAALTSISPVDSEFEFRWLTSAEVCAYAADPANDLDAAMAAHLEQSGHYCLAVLKGSVLASYSWYALHSISPEHSLGTGLTFPTDSVYFYKAFTRPEYRGRGLHPAALQYAAAFFKARSISRLIAIVECANWPSLRSHEKLGFRQAGSFVHMGGRRLRFERYPKLADRLGIRLGHSAKLF